MSAPGCDWTVDAQTGRMCDAPAAVVLTVFGTRVRVCAAHQAQMESRLVAQGLVFTATAVEPESRRYVWLVEKLEGNGPGDTSLFGIYGDADLAKAAVDKWEDDLPTARRLARLYNSDGWRLHDETPHDFYWRNKIGTYDEWYVSRKPANTPLF